MVWFLRPSRFWGGRGFCPSPLKIGLQSVNLLAAVWSRLQQEDAPHPALRSTGRLSVLSFWMSVQGPGELAPKSNLLYVYSPTSRAHLWPDVCLTNMSNRRASVAWVACPGTLLTAEPWGPQSRSLKTSHETISQVSSQRGTLLIETRNEGRGLFKTVFLCEKKQTGCEEMNGNEEWTLIRKCCRGLCIPFITFGKCKRIFELF